jgi:HSP20 family molecular chaperone IbpA
MQPVRSIDLLWTQACELMERADRLHRQFFRLGQAGQLAVWEPPVDIFESESELLIRVAVPDINQEDFEIQYEGTMLRLSGRRCLPQEAARHIIRRLEIPYGPMQRAIRLPPGQFRLAAHAYNNGCLEIRMLRVIEND